VKNSSGWEAKGKAVLTRPFAPEREVGLIEIPSHVLSALNIHDNRVVVVDIGDDAWSDEAKPRAELGDVAIVTNFAGYMMKGEDGQAYRVVNDRDLFLVKSKEAQNG